MVSSYNTDYIHRLKKNDEVPLNAIALSETDVLELKFNTLKKMSLRDTRCGHFDTASSATPRYRQLRWPLTYGIYGAATAASLTGVAVLALYRLRFRVSRVHLAPAYPAVVVIPFATTGCFYHATVVQPVMTDKNLCSVCLQVRACLIGGILGFLQPTLIAGISAMLVSQKYKTVSLPDGLVAKLRLHRRIMRQNALPIGLILLANVCLANFVPMKVTTVNQLVNHFLTNPGSEFQ